MRRLEEDWFAMVLNGNVGEISRKCHRAARSKGSSDLMNDTKHGSKQDLGMLGHSCHAQAHEEEGCDGHDTGCLFCGGLNTETSQASPQIGAFYIVSRMART